MALAAHDLALLSPEPSTDGNAALELLVAHPALRRLGDDVAHAPEGDPAWSRAELTGRLCELSAGADGALLSAAMSVVLDAQLNGDPVAWVSATAATFYPPDAAACGVDLSALIVVRAIGARAAGRAADVLLRSGAFGLVVLDLGTSATLPAPLQGRLVQLASKHDAAVVCLTEKAAHEDSLGSLVSLRGEVRRLNVRRGVRKGTEYAYRVRVLKDKRRGPGWWVEEGRCCHFA
ncbi:MAG: recombinase A [Candidatus Krumholzibacteria bacterium]|nr:recombinase A [Candidatus Krumholzibacteria bacterium]